MENIIFREYQIADHDFVCSGILEIENIETDKATSLNLSADFDQQLSQWIEKTCKVPANLIIIAEINSKPCGFIIGIVELQQNQFTSYQTHGMVQAIWVSPENRQCGVGKLLLDQILDSFSQFKIPYCDIAFHPENQVAKSFWHKMGFIDAQIISRKFLVTLKS